MATLTPNPLSAVAAAAQTWLVWRSGSQAGMRYPVFADSTSVGRSPGNHIVIQGSDVASVSQYHFTIERDDSGFHIRDLDSTNGTFLNGERISCAELEAPATIRLGSHGPELAFVLDQSCTATPLDATQVIPVVAIGLESAPPPLGPTCTYELLLSEAVENARRARASGVADQTMTIMREALDRALHRTSKRFRTVIAALVTGLVLVSGYAGWNIREKHLIDQRIQDIEKRLEATTSMDEADRLITQLDGYENQGERLARSPLYRVGLGGEDFVTEEIRAVMTEFGAEAYSVPPEFTERVNYYIQDDQGTNRDLMVKVLGRARRQFATVRQVLEDHHLPPDLAYVALVESSLNRMQQSAAGAAGPWQFTTTTAKAYGLRVDDQIDERTDVLKATRAACRYLRELILDFGNGSSVMLALAAYNEGPTKVKAAVKKAVQDPIKQRNFWYLYRTRALPAETREYVPKVMAAILIGRNPAHYGFLLPTTRGD